MTQSERPVDMTAKVMNRFEEYTKHCDFKAFHIKTGATLEAS
jgi:hypothetical protein